MLGLPTSAGEAAGLLTPRVPGERETQILAESLGFYRDEFQGDPAAAARYVSHGEAPRDERLDVRELAAYAAVASLILNLDAAVTKE